MYLSSTSTIDNNLRQPVSVFHVELVTASLVASSRPVLFRGHARLSFSFCTSSQSGLDLVYDSTEPYTLPPRLYQTTFESSRY